MQLSNFGLLTDVFAHGWGIALNALGLEWDLHNYADFEGFDYSTTHTSSTTLILKWHIAERVVEWRDAQSVPNAQQIPIYPSNRFCLVFSDVDYLQVLPRDPEMPSDEDKTVRSVSCIGASEDTGEYAASGAVPVYDPNTMPLSFHLVFRFQGGQFIRVGAEKAEFVLME